MRRKVVVLNLGVDHVQDLEVLGSEWLARSAWRHAWLLDRGDLAVTPVGPPQELLEHIATTLGFAPSDVSIVETGRLLTDDVLLDDRLVAELRARTAQGGTWALSACFMTAGVAALAGRLGARPVDDTGFAAQGGIELLNRKSHFRRIFGPAGLPLPAGSVVDGPDALLRALDDHLPATGCAIVKRDDGAGGLGNVGVVRDPVAAPLTGTAATVAVAAGDRAAAARLWQRVGSRGAAVVESYHAAQARFYAEFDIGADGVPTLLDTGTIRSGVGLEIPAELAPGAAAPALSCTTRAAEVAARLGYRGLINVDGIATRDGEVYVNETNARWGGCTVLNDVARRLLGDGYHEHRVLASVGHHRAWPLRQVRRALRDRGILFDARVGEGVLILTTAPEGLRTMDLMVVALDRPAARRIERELESALEPLERPDSHHHRKELA